MTKDITSTHERTKSLDSFNSIPPNSTLANSLLSSFLPNDEAEKGTDVFLENTKTRCCDVLKKFFTDEKVNTKANNIVKVNNIVKSILGNINSNQTKEQSENAAEIRISINDEEGNVFKRILAVYAIDNEVLKGLPHPHNKLLTLNTDNPHKLQDADVNQLCDELVQQRPKIVTTLFALCFPNEDIIKSWSTFSPHYSIPDIWNNKNQALEEFQKDLTLSDFRAECFPYYSVQCANMNATLQEVFTEFQKPPVNKGFFSSVLSSIFNTVYSLGSLLGLKKAAPTPEGTPEGANNFDKNKASSEDDITTLTPQTLQEESRSFVSKILYSISSIIPAIGSLFGESQATDIQALGKAPDEKEHDSEAE